MDGTSLLKQLNYFLKRKGISSRNSVSVLDAQLIKDLVKYGAPTGFKYHHYKNNQFSISPIIQEMEKTYPDARLLRLKELLGE